MPEKCQISLLVFYYHRLTQRLMAPLWSHQYYLTISWRHLVLASVSRLQVNLFKIGPDLSYRSKSVSIFYFNLDLCFSGIEPSPNADSLSVGSLITNLNFSVIVHKIQWFSLKRHWKTSSAKSVAFLRSRCVWWGITTILIGLGQCNEDRVNFVTFGWIIRSGHGTYIVTIYSALNFLHRSPCDK